MSLPIKNRRCTECGSEITHLAGPPLCWVCAKDATDALAVVRHGGETRRAEWCRFAASAALLNPEHFTRAEAVAYSAVIADEMQAEADKRFGCVKP